MILPAAAPDAVAPRPAGRPRAMNRKTGYKQKQGGSSGRFHDGAGQPPCLSRAEYPLPAGIRGGPYYPR